MPLDPIILSVIHNGLGMVASEMDLAQEKMSFSPIISESMDRANGVYHRANGDIIVQGANCLPLFHCVMQATVAVDRKSGVAGKRVSVLLDLGGRRIINKT